MLPKSSFVIIAPPFQTLYYRIRTFAYRKRKPCVIIFGGIRADGWNNTADLACSSNSSSNGSNNDCSHGGSSVAYVEETEETITISYNNYKLSSNLIPAPHYLSASPSRFLPPMGIVGVLTITIKWGYTQVNII